VRFSLFRYLIIALILVSGISCNKRPPRPKSDEGIIEYRIIYFEDKVGSISPGLLPQTMEMKFKKNKVKNTIEGAMGFFSLINIADLNEMTNATFIKFIDKKYVYRGQKREKPCCITPIEGMEITFTDETKEIIGLTSKRAIVSFPGSDNESFSIYYTTEIRLKNPNITSPYKEIPGVLLEFRANLGQSEIQVVAQNYKSQYLPDKEFHFPRNYKEISKQEMEKIINALLE